MSSHFQAKRPSVLVHLFAFPFVALLISGTIWFGQGDDPGSVSSYTKASVILVFSLSTIGLFFFLDDTLRALQDNWAYFAFLCYVTVASLWAQDPLSGIRVAAYFWGGASVCLLAAIGYRNRLSQFLLLFVVFAGAAFAASFVIVFHDPVRSVDESGRWLGITPHPNVLGVLAVIGTWASTSLLFETSSRLIRFVSGAVLVSAGVCVYGANSVTGMIVSLLILLIIVSSRFRGTKSVGALVRWFSVLGLLIVLFFLGHLALVGDTFNAATVFEGLGRDGSFTGRDSLWLYGLQSIVSRPVLGTGFDEVVSIGGVDIKHFHSGYIDLLVRGGFVALGFFAVVVGTLGLAISRLSGFAQIIFFALLVGILLHNVTEGSFGRGITPLWLFFSFLCFSAPMVKRPSRTTHAGLGRFAEHAARTRFRG